MKSRTRFYGAEIVSAAVYICSVSAALMYVICREYAVLCTVIMTAVSFGVYMLFYVLRRHKGFAALVAAAFAAMCVAFAAGMQAPSYYSSEHSFIDFIFTASTFFNPLYAVAAIFIFSVTVGFMCCFFSVYSPRPCFLMLVSFIPLILSVRTAGGIPLPLLAFMMGGFVMAAGGMARAEQPSEYIYADDRRSRRERLIALALAGLAAAGITAVVPRSDKTPMGDYLDTVFSGTTGGYYAVSQQLTNFRMQSSVNRGANEPTGTVLFTVAGDVPKYIDRAAFDVYEGGTDGWTVISEFDMGYSGWETHAKLADIPTFINKLKAAAEDGKLEKYADMLEKIPEQDDSERTAFIQIVDGSSTAVILHPEGVYYVKTSGYSGSTYRNARGDLFTAQNLAANTSYTLKYYNGTPDAEAASALAGVDFEQLVNDAQDENVISAVEAQSLLYERDSADEYRRGTGSEGVSDRIQKLADEITEGLSSDYEKAAAIEQWFGDNGFTYDLDFVPQKIDPEYFLFESRRGICSDYATAAALLARAAGLSARYTEGFYVTEDIRGENDDIYYVTDAQYHAYVTIYAEGCGSVIIDGTRYAAAAAEEDSSAFAWIAAAAVAAALLVFIFRKQLSELLFAVSFPFRSPASKVRGVYLRTRKLAADISGRAAESMTVGDTAGVVSRSLGLPEEAERIRAAADGLFYGNGEANDPKTLLKTYRTIRRRKRRMRK